MTKMKKVKKMKKRYLLGDARIASKNGTDMFAVSAGFSISAESHQFFESFRLQRQIFQRNSDNWI